MKSRLFSGVATALITPFDGEKIDYPALRRIVGYQIDHGVDALVICGTTGEAPTLSALEKLRCVAAVAEAADKRVPVIAGCGTNDTAFSARLSRLACREGADGILAVTPYYNRPTPQGLAEHFLTLAKEAEKPVIVYNVPSRTGCDIADQTYDILAKEKLIAGVKEASGRVSRSAELMVRYGDDLPLYSGNDDLTLPLLSIGAAGVISVTANLLPTEMHDLYRLYSEGKTKEAERLHRNLMPLHRVLFCETNPIPVKAAMAYLGFCRPDMRLPLTEARVETVTKLTAALKPLLG